jgi:hypothetical protein
MRLPTALAAALVICGLSGCGRDHTVACDATDRYAAASTAPPVRIPDDLSPPDESDSLRLPPEAVAPTAPTRPCLQSPPGFYAEGAPGGTRLGNAPARPAPTPAPATPAAAPEPSVPPPPGDDRQIDN